jgi:hypothetical protein
VRFVHVGVPGVEERPCAVVCLDCAGKPEKTSMYSGIGPAVKAGSFLVFLK